MQKELIRKYMRDFGSISPMQAFSDLGITKLATRIGEMIGDGEKIGKRKRSGLNRYGKTVSWMEYYYDD